MEKIECAYCGKEFEKDIYTEDTDFSREYNGYVCEECYQNHFGYCDECGEFFQYHDKMIEHNKTGVLCKRCLENCV